MQPGQGDGEPTVGRDASAPGGGGAAPRPTPPPRNPVDDAREELANLDQRPLAEHPDAFARVHAGLQQALSDIDDA